MRRSNKIYLVKRRHLYIVLVVLTVVLWCQPMTLIAHGSTGIAFDHYDDVNIQESQPPDQSSNSSDPGPTTEDAALSKEELDVREFNGSALDTILYILGGISGFLMIIQISLFVMAKVFPTTNRFLEKFKKIGIDGYADGYVFPTIKILLLGFFAYFCISGTFKRVIIYIISWFVTNTS